MELLSLHLDKWYYSYDPAYAREVLSCVRFYSRWLRLDIARTVNHSFSAYLNEEIRDMSKKIKRDYTTQVTWANAYLNTSDEATIDDWMRKRRDEVLGWAFALTTRGGTVTIKPAPDKNSIMAVLIIPNPDDPASATGVSGFAEDPLAALAVAVYKWTVLLDEQHAQKSAKSRYS